MNYSKKQKEYVARVARYLDGIEGVNSGLCSTCKECQDIWGAENPDSFQEAIEEEVALDEGSFTWSGCEICNSSLGGLKFIGHGTRAKEHRFTAAGKKFVFPAGEIIHFGSICQDCVAYLANGDVPDDEYL